MADIQRRAMLSIASQGLEEKSADHPQEYATLPPFVKIEFEYVTHLYEGRAVTFALDKEAKDSYTQALRAAPQLEHYIPFILRRARLKGGDFKVADFGANVGVVSLPLAANGLRVLAIEALPANFLALATAAKVNGLSNLLPINMAAMEGPGLVSFAGTSAWATAGIAGGDVTVSCNSLVNILRNYGFSDADLIKIDIEGAELSALSGADKFLSERPEVDIIFESNNHTCHLFGYDRQDLLHWFHEKGFSTYVFRADCLMPIGHEDPQPIPVVDILATKRSPDELRQSGETIVAMTDDYILEELLRISASSNPHIQHHFITEVGRVDKGVRQAPHWERIASALKSHPSELLLHEVDADRPGVGSATVPAMRVASATIDGEQFVAALYRAALLREPDPRGLLAHVNALKDGKAPEQIAREFLHSAEFLSRIAGFAQQYPLDLAAPMSVDLDLTSAQEQLLWARVARAWANLGRFRAVLVCADGPAMEVGSDDGS